MSALGPFALLNTLDPAATRELEEAISWSWLDGGEVLYRPSDTVEVLYLVRHGKVAEFADLDRSGTFERDEMIRQVGRGQIAGLLGLVDGETYGTLGVTVRSCEVGRLPTALFEKHARAADWRGAARTAAATTRALLLGERFEPPISNVILLPGSPNLDLADFARRLIGEMQEVNVRLLDRAAIRTASGAWVGSRARALTWMAEQEEACDLAIYVADALNSRWVRRIVPQADRILVVAEAASDPAPSEHELRLLEGIDPVLRPMDLVLIHDAGTDIPEGTARWLHHRPRTSGVHHITRGSEHLGRLGRVLLGRTVGLVLGAGGARGLAGIGAVAALRELGATIDAVGGTSAGAIVGAMTALAWDEEQMVDTVWRELVEGGAFSPTVLPYHSMISKTRSDRITRKVFGAARIEDLWLPYFAVSCDLTTGRRHIHRRGTVWRAVRASSAIPGVIPPVLLGRSLLVDGAAVDYLHVDVMRELHRGPVLTVDVGAPVAKVPDDMVDLPTNFQAYLYRFHPLLSSRPIPTIAQMLFYTGTIAARNSSAHLTDLLVQPDVGHFETQDFDGVHEMVARGYNAMMASLESAPPALLIRLSIDPDRVEQGLPRREIPLEVAQRRASSERVRRLRSHALGGALLGGAAGLVVLCGGGPWVSPVTGAGLGVASALVRQLWSQTTAWVRQRRPAPEPEHDPDLPTRPPPPPDLPPPTGGLTRGTMSRTMDTDQG
jgi:predicted acylesterase/phospholipase RssA/CRP-like cAMP-binding protein